MNWQRLLDVEVKKFIAAHEGADVPALALKASPDPHWDYPLVLEQIKARQKATGKVPSWLSAHDDVVFPPAFVLEQASSSVTARYKAGLVEGRSFIDLTGGAGVDTWAFLERFERGVCVERDPVAAALIAHNMGLLGDRPVDVVCGDSAAYVANMEAVDFAYIDPQRRDEDGAGGRRGRYRLEETSPDVLALLPELLSKAGTVMVKTSPVLDIWAGIEVLRFVEAVHIVEWRGECKEVLYILRDAGGAALALEDVPVHVVSLDDAGEALSHLSFTKAQEMRAAPAYSLPLSYLYEPSPAFQKSGAFKVMAVHYGAGKLHPHTHLYTSDQAISDFPGRGFEIVGCYPAQASKIPVRKAHLTLRNFPQKTEILKKKLKLSDGGDDYLFACSLMDGRKVVLHGRKFC